MLKSLSKIAFIILLPLAAFGQEDTLSFRERYMPTGIRVGMDAISLGRHIYDDNFTGWEASADIDFHRYMLAIDYGKWGLRHQGDLLDYENDGRYYRAGVDVNFLTKDPERNMFFLGFRYGRGKFDETFKVLDEDIYWGENDRWENPYRNIGLTARWFELTTGLKVKMLHWLWMGYTARFKFGLKTGETFELEPHDVPGYGKTHKETTWGFNYNLMIRIPVRPHPPLPPVKKKKK